MVTTSRDASLTDEAPFGRAGFDAVAVKPTEHDLGLVPDLPVDTAVLDYEGQSNVPERAVLADLAATVDLRVTTPVRADGFDPLGDDGRLEVLPESCSRVLVAGHPAYLDDREVDREVAPRLGAAVEHARDPWVGTERMERLALAAGGTQYELLDRSTERTLHRLRTTGYDGSIAVYAPTVLSDDEATILDAVGDYAARRAPVRAALPDDARTDAAASGRAREVLSAAVRDYALVGSPATVRERVESLRSAGATTVVGYPARGLEAVL